MKNIIMAISMMIIALFYSEKGKAQITLEQVFDSTNIGFDFYITDIGNNNSKYVFIDTTANSFSLYNLDGSPFMINIATPDPIMPDYTVAYITNSLFDCDSTNIEYAFMSYQNYYKPFRILRTDGTVLLNADSSRGPVCYGCLAGTKEIVPIVNTQEGAKLFLFKYDTNYVRKTFVYGLCGTLPNSTSILDFTLFNSNVKLYPNPTEMTINIEVTLPNNITEFKLTIFDSQANILQNEILTYTNSKLTLDVSNLSNGMYYYSLTSKNKNYQTGKFILTK